MKKLLIVALLAFSFATVHAQRSGARAKVLGGNRGYVTQRTVVVQRPHTSERVYTINRTRAYPAYGRHYYHPRYYYRHDNGRHLGWYKGRHNPHRYYHKKRRW